jgi:glycosyl transferase family 25
MKAHAISLARSQRRSQAVSRAAAVGLTLEMFDAVDALTDETVRAEHDRAAASFRARYGRPQTIGELACLLSHQRLYEALAARQDDYHLVLEDDFVPLVDSTVIERITSAAATRVADVVILGYAKADAEDERGINLSNPLMEATPVTGTDRLIGFRCIETTCGALSYLCSRRFVEAMAADVDYGRLADDWSYHRKLGLRIMHVKPLCFREDYAVMASSLDGERAPAINKSGIRLPPFLRPLWRRSCGIVRMLRYHVSPSYAGKSGR